MTYGCQFGGWLFFFSSSLCLLSKAMIIFLWKVFPIYLGEFWAKYAKTAAVSDDCDVTTRSEGEEIVGGGETPETTTEKYLIKINRPAHYYKSLTSIFFATYC